jgi:diguanylate cyclase (GGDEF)-like protein
MAPLPQLLTEFLPRFDPRTLFGCQSLLAILFAAVFFWMRHSYPGLRGIRSVAFSFVLGIPATFLLLARGNISDFLSINLADLLITATFVLLYDGVVLFVEGTRKTLWLAAAALAANAVVYYASPAHNATHADIVPRILAITLFCALVRALIAWELLSHSLTARHSNYTVANNRTAMRFLGVVVALTSIAGTLRGLWTAHQPSPQTYLHANAIQSAAMLFNVAYLGIFGLSFLLISGHELIARSQEESEKDLLSGAFNRRGIESRLATELKRYSRAQHALSIALVDVDHFKAINDLFGHAAGDAAIRNVCHTIAGNLRDSDYLGRYGGDEFLLVFPGTPPRHAIVALERLARAVAAIPLPGGAPPLTLSIGLTEICLEDDPAAAIARADQALYLAKTNGRNRHQTLLPLNPTTNLELPAAIRTPRNPQTQTHTKTHTQSHTQSRTPVRH